MLTGTRNGLLQSVSKRLLSTCEAGAGARRAAAGRESRGGWGLSHRDPLEEELRGSVDQKLWEGSTKKLGVGSHKSVWRTQPKSSL